MAIDRFCCCALTSKQLAESARDMMCNENQLFMKVNAASSDSDVFNPLRGLVQEHQAATRLDSKQAAACFLAITHSNSERFAPLYVDTVEDLFPKLQATLQQRPQEKSSSNTSNGIEAAEHQQGGWHPYLLAGSLGALEFFDSHSPLAAGSLTAQSWPAFLERIVAKLPRVSIKATVSGNLPLGAGLSSSSALVVTIITAVITALGCRATSKEVAEVSARAERYVGVEGMHALNSRRANSVLHSSGEALQPFDLSYVQKTFLGSLEDAGRLVDSVLHEEAYEKAELKKLLGGCIDQLLKELPALSGAWEKNNEFELKRRARHVFSEALRVQQFVQVCKGNHSDSGKLNVREEQPASIRCYLMHEGTRALATPRGRPLVTHEPCSINLWLRLRLGTWAAR
ncbi:hypothetical protein Emag_005251 [Eimeria magna]